MNTNKKTIILICAILLIIVSVLIVVFLISGRKRQIPPEKKIEKLSILSEPSLDAEEVKDVTKFNVSLPNVKKMTVYSVDNVLGGKILTYSGRSEIASMFGFSGEPREVTDAVTEETIYLWSQKEARFTLYKGTGNIMFTRDIANFSPSALGQLPSPEEAQSVVLDLVSKLESPGEDVSFKLGQVVYREAGAAVATEVSASAADLIEVTFLSKVGDYNIVNETGEKASAVVAWFGKGGELLKFIYRPVGELQEVGKYPIKDEEEVYTDLQNGKGTIVNLGTGTYTEDLTQGLDSIVVDRAALAYMQPGLESPYLQPIFSFTGIAKLADGTKTSITIYLPAVEDRYFK